MNLYIATLLIAFSATMILAQQAPAEGEEIPPADKPPAIMPAGMYWYGMYAADGEAQGFARLTATAQEGGGMLFDWELRIAYEGGKYEEQRKLALDSQAEMIRAEVASSGRSRIATRDGSEMIFKADEEEQRVKVVNGAISAGMAFVLATSIEQREGATLTRHTYDEANEFKDLGEATFSVEKKEALKLPAGETEAWKILLKRGEDRSLQVWVNSRREIVQIDWGSGTLMKRHKEETTSLYKPGEPTFKQLEAEDKSKLQLEGVFPGFSLEEMWKHWTTAEGQAAWWAPKAEIEGKVGGKYELRWPKPDGDGYLWELLGKVTHWEEHKTLGFTWRWSNEPEDQILYVVVEFEAVEGGVKLKATHSEFNESKESQANRQSLHDGWEWFGTRLKNLKK